MIYRYFFAGLCCLLPFFVRAEVVSQLFDAEALVATQSGADRAAAAKVAMQHVVVRLTGQPGASTHPLVVKGMANAENYLQEFGYEPVVAAATGAESTGWSLKMKFSQPALSRLLREAGLTVWSSQRPSTLAWIVIDNGSGAIQADQYEQGLGQRLVESAARDRGVPVILPLMDLQDQMAYDPARIVALDMDGLTAASLRYKPDAILLGSITRKDDMLWSAQWSLRLRDRVTRFDASGDTLEAAVDAGLAATVRTMVAVYTVNTTVQQAPAVITLAVQAINDFPRYRRMLGLLQDMEPVKKVSVQKIEADEVLYQLDIVGNTQLVADLLALSGSLRPVAVPDTKAGAAINQQDPQRKRPDLYYRWE